MTYDGSNMTPKQQKAYDRYQGDAAGWQRYAYANDIPGYNLDDLPPKPTEPVNWGGGSVPRPEQRFLRQPQVGLNGFSQEQKASFMENLAAQQRQQQQGSYANDGLAAAGFTNAGRPPAFLADPSWQNTSSGNPGIPAAHIEAYRSFRGNPEGWANYAYRNNIPGYDVNDPY